MSQIPAHKVYIMEGNVSEIHNLFAGHCWYRKYAEKGSESIGWCWGLLFRIQGVIEIMTMDNIVHSSQVEIFQPVFI